MLFGAGDARVLPFSTLCKASSRIDLCPVCDTRTTSTRMMNITCTCWFCLLPIRHQQEIRRPWLLSLHRSSEFPGTWSKMDMCCRCFSAFPSCLLLTPPDALQQPPFLLSRCVSHCHHRPSDRRSPHGLQYLSHLKPCLPCAA